MSLLQALNLPPPPTASAKPVAAADKAAPKGAKSARLLQAAEAWRQTHGQAEQRLAALRAAVRSHCADASPALVREIDKGLRNLDTVLGNVDQRLADSLASAGSAGDDEARQAELKKAKSILAEYAAYVQGDPLVAHIDRNPFGVKTGLQAMLAGGLAKAAKAI